MNAQQLVAEIRGWLIWAIDLGLILLLFAMVAQQFGIRLPSIPQVAPATAVYVFGARWLLK